MQPRPRVFVSSIMEGYRDYREAARLGIERAGGTAVLVEDEPARPASPRSACLDLVASCDAVITIIGPRGGYRAPSGKLVVREEFDEARSRGIPTVLLLHDGDRDADGEKLARDLSDWVDGRLRRSFSSPQELATEVERALAPLLDTMSKTPQDPSTIQALVEKAAHGGGQYDAVLKIVFAPAVVEEVVDPLLFDSADFQRKIQREAHDTELFSYEFPKDTRTTSEQLIIKQSERPGRGSGYAEISISSSGLFSASIQVTGSSEDCSGQRFFSSTFEILRDDLAGAASVVFRFVAGLLAQIDPHSRYSSWMYNASLANPGSRRIVDQPARSNQGSSMGWGEPGVVTCYDQPRKINRATMARPDEEVQRIVGLLKRRLDDARNPY